MSDTAPDYWQELMEKLYDPQRDGYESGSEGDFPIEQRALERIKELEGERADLVKQCEEARADAADHRKLYKEAEEEAVSWHEQYEGMCSERNWFAEEADALRPAHDAYKAAATILYGAIQDLKELGATVAICGIEPDVMRALEEARNPTPQETADE